MRKLLIFILSLFMLITLVAASEFKIGVVDLNRVLNNCKRGREAKTRLLEEYNRLKAEIDKKRSEVEALKKILDERSGILSEKAKKEKEKEYRDKLRELRAMMEEARIELARKEQELTTKIVEDIINFVKSYAEKKGYALIINKDETVKNIIFVAPKYDLTDEVIKAYDKKYKTKSR